MPELIAQGPMSDNRWRRTIPMGRPFTVGRQAASWSTPWDDRISRRHLQACWQHGRLEVKKLPEARNSLFFRGKPNEHILLKPGEHFVVGGTTFTLTEADAQVSLDDPEPVTEHVFTRSDLERLRFRDPGQRIEVLSRLPRVIGGAISENELSMRMVNLLLSGVPHASLAAVVSATPDATSADSPPAVRIEHWDRRGPSQADFRPSARLIGQAVRQQESRLSVWRGEAGSSYTQADNVDWAMCVPVPGSGWALYLAGDFPEAAGSDLLRDDLKFVEVAARALGNFREVRSLERQHASLSQFFSPVVLEALAGRDPDQVLAARETDVSVLFCDLRGFSRQSERDAADLLGLLRRVSDALGVMTHYILDTGGVVGDFHGDAAMGFWGWPLEQPDAARRAAQAALGIRQAFADAAQQPNHPLADFRVGIGIASGRAVAGKIGTIDQVKVTVFGPVVNLAARLETMTKQLRAPILLDEPTAAALAQADRSFARLRRIARLRPYGLEQAIEVSELVPPLAEFPQLEDQHLEAYEAALDQLLAGNWDQAFELLHEVPAEDRVKDFLTIYIAQHNRVPPKNWDGIITLHEK